MRAGCFLLQEAVFLLPVLIYLGCEVLGMGILIPHAEPCSLWPCLFFQGQKDASRGREVDAVQKVPVLNWLAAKRELVGSERIGWVRIKEVFCSECLCSPF